MKLQKGFLSLLIATVLTSSALIVPSIKVYAATTPNVSATATSAATTSASITSPVKIIKDVGMVYDSVHKIYVYAGLAAVTGNSGTYTEGIVLTFDTNGKLLTNALAPNMDEFQSIVTDQKGDVVIGSCHNQYTNVPGYNSQPIPKYMGTSNYIYTTNDGGQTWTQTASGNRMVSFITGMYYSGYSGPIYLGRTQSITYSGDQFVATGEYGAKFYSSNGYNWHQ